MNSKSKFNEMNYKFILDKSSKKYICPRCNKRKLVRYVNTSNNNYLPADYGRCDSESSCGYHLKPTKENNQQNTIYQRKDVIEFEFHYSSEIVQSLKKIKGSKFNPVTKQWSIATKELSTEVKSFAKKHNFTIIDYKPKPLKMLIPTDVLTQTIGNYDKNTFIQGLLKRYNKIEVTKVIEWYYLGTVSSSLSIPYIDKIGQIRAIQVKQFDNELHTTSTNWVHALPQFKGDWLEPYKLNESKVSCLFGEHLLNRYPGKPIALVESPKTAIIATLHFGFNNYLWLAVFNKSSFKYKKLKVLTGRKVLVFPDLGAFNDWKVKAATMPNIDFTFDEILEIEANEQERLKGLDLADFILTKNVSRTLEQ